MSRIVRSPRPLRAPSTRSQGLRAPLSSADPFRFLLFGYDITARPVPFNHIRPPGHLRSLEIKMPYQEFRQFLDVLRQQGELIDVDRPIALTDVGKALKQAYQK